MLFLLERRSLLYISPRAIISIEKSGIARHLYWQRFLGSEKASKLQQWEFVEVGGSVDPEPPEDGETLAKLKKKFRNCKYWNQHLFIFGVLCLN